MTADQQIQKVKEQLAAEIKTRRTQRGDTVQAMAEEMGWDKSRWSRAENLKGSVSLERLLAMAYEMELTPQLSLKFGS